MDYKKESAELIAQTSKKLIEIIGSASFEFWQRPDFRLFIKFPQLSKTEQDRIFNELELSVLGLFVLHFENSLPFVRDEQKIIISALQKDLPMAFLQLFSELGIEKAYISQWNNVVNKRLKEYRTDFKTAVKTSQQWREFKKDEVYLRIAWARIETITIDCLTHIRRGDVKDGDPLWKLLRKWLITLDAQLNPITSIS